MVLSDLVSEYYYVKNILDPCKDYFTTCNDIIDNYFSSISRYANNYFKAASITEAHKNNLISGLSNTYSETYNQITKLITLSFPFYGALAKLETYKFSNPLLKENVLEFLNYGQSVMESTNKIITAQLPGMKTEMLLPELISPLQKLMRTYHTLTQLYSHLHSADEIIMEKLPESVVEDERYNTFELRSYKKNISLDDYSKDLHSIFLFISQLEVLKKADEITPCIYLRKIESGSLRLAFGSNTIELNSISDIIRSITEGIRTFRLTSVEKSAMAENTRKLRIENDTKELSIINSQIKTLCETLNLSSENPEDVEKIQKLCLPIVRYINNNPIGKAGDYKYDLTHELELLEDFYLRN